MAHGARSTSSVLHVHMLDGQGIRASTRRGVLSPCHSARSCPKKFTLSRVGMVAHQKKTETRFVYLNAFLLSFHSHPHSTFHSPRLTLIIPIQYSLVHPSPTFTHSLLLPRNTVLLVPRIYPRNTSCSSPITYLPFLVLSIPPSTMIQNWSSVCVRCHGPDDNGSKTEGRAFFHNEYQPHILFFTFLFLAWDA